MTEPTYIYKKGEGWVVTTARPFPSDLGVLCNTCGKRAGMHHYIYHWCPVFDKVGDRVLGTGKWGERSWS